MGRGEAAMTSGLRVKASAVHLAFNQLPIAENDGLLTTHGASLYNTRSSDDSRIRRGEESEVVEQRVDEVIQSSTSGASFLGSRVIT